jgi:glyoxylase-like metal-dependent hydrolase (beta-lactamase superfamily II)
MRFILTGVLIALLVPFDLVAQDATAVIESAARAMGTTTLRAIHYAGTGSSFTVGQASGPGAPWPRFQVVSYVGVVNYTTAAPPAGAASASATAPVTSWPAMREEFVRRDVENPPRGGGAGPFIPTTGQGGMRPIPGDVRQTLVRDARTDAGAAQIAMTPHGFLKAAAAYRASVTTRRDHGRSVHVVSFAIGTHPVTGVIGEQGLVERVETRLFNNVLGDMIVEAIYSDYRDFGGVTFPGRIQQRQAGHPTLDLAITTVEPNAATALAVTGAPQRPAGPAPATLTQAASTQAGPTQAAPAPTPLTVEVEKIADHVWFLNGGAPVSLLVEFADHVVVIEAPQNDERTEVTIAAVKRVTPGKPIRWVVNTHHHFDHSGGVRAFVAEGIPILTHQRNKAYWERILANPFTLNPDRLARAPRKPVIDTVGDTRVLRDSTMALELYHVRGSLHDDALLMAYLPRTKMLVQSDTFHPRPGAAPLAAPPPFTINLVENVRRLGLDVERIVQVHGGIEPWSAVLKAAGQ